MFLIDQLEIRRMLSASLDHGMLTVDGTSGNDNMVVVMDRKQKTKLDVKVNGVVEKFNLKDVKDIRMFGLDGNDIMKIDQRNGKVKIPVTMDGGTGNDMLVAGAGSAVMHGGDGNDTLIGGSGNDNMDGGSGTDSLVAGTGKDLFHKEHDTMAEIHNFKTNRDRME